jgi:SAM-dependent methyltransferase
VAIWGRERVGRALRELLVHPLARGLHPDDPAAPAIHRLMIQQKPLLRDVYREWYEALAIQIGGARPVLEVGSGAGHLADYIPNVISSDVRPTPATKVVLDGHHLPFASASLGAITMTNVVHHLPDVVAFLHEAGRVVRPGGVMAVIEPWVTPWSAWVYRHLHHEPFDEHATDWQFPRGGPLSAANGALPWIVFARDRARFEHECPEWKVELVQPGWPLRYLISGGVSLRALAPRRAARVLRWIDRRLERRADRWAMFALVVLRRRDSGV